MLKSLSHLVQNCTSLNFSLKIAVIPFWISCCISYRHVHKFNSINNSSNTTAFLEEVGSWKL